MGLDYKVLCVPVGDPLWSAVKDPDHVPPDLLALGFRRAPSPDDGAEVEHCGARHG
jgi:hypothetical protein